MMISTCLGDGISYWSGARLLTIKLVKRSLPAWPHSISIDLEISKSPKNKTEEGWNTPKKNF